MSFTCTLFSDKVRCFNQLERALYGNFIIIDDVIERALQTYLLIYHRLHAEYLQYDNANSNKQYE